MSVFPLSSDASTHFHMETPSLRLYLLNWLWRSCFHCRGYKHPVKVSDERLQEACRQFACGVLSALKSPSLSSVDISLEHDVWRYVTFHKGKSSEHRGHFLFSNQDLSRLKYLPTHWWYFMNEHGEGTAIDFPIKIKPVLSWSSAHCFVKNGYIMKAKRLPLEKLCISIAKRPCNVNTLMEIIWMHLFNIP